MSAKTLRWVMTDAGEPLVAADSGIDGPGPDQAVIDIDSCAVWCGDLDYHFGDVHTLYAPTHALRHEVSGRVVEAGANALYYTDRAVVLAVIPPTDPDGGCGFGAAALCPAGQAPHNRADCGCGNSVIVPARELYLAARPGPASSKSGRTACAHR